MTYLGRDEILAAQDVDTRDVEVPEWGGTVLVRGLSGTERDAYEQSLTMVRGKEWLPNLTNLRSKLVARAIINEDGTRVFTDNDIAALGAKSSIALSRVFDVVRELSGLEDDAVEDAEGNSDAAESGESISS